MSTTNDRDYELALMMWESEGGFIPGNRAETNGELDGRAAIEEPAGDVEDQDSCCVGKQERQPVADSCAIV